MQGMCQSSQEIRFVQAVEIARKIQNRAYQQKITVNTVDVSFDSYRRNSEVQFSGWFMGTVRNVEFSDYLSRNP